MHGPQVVTVSQSCHSSISWKPKRKGEKERESSRRRLSPPSAPPPSSVPTTAHQQHSSGFILFVGTKEEEEEEEGKKKRGRDERKGRKEGAQCVPRPPPALPWSVTCDTAAAPRRASRPDECMRKKNRQLWRMRWRDEEANK